MLLGGVLHQNKRFISLVYFSVSFVTDVGASKPHVYFAGLMRGKLWFCFGGPHAVGFLGAITPS